jgi:hypothetical protein
MISLKILENDDFLPKNDDFCWKWWLFVEETMSWRVEGPRRQSLKVLARTGGTTHPLAVFESVVLKLLCCNLLCCTTEYSAVMLWCSSELFCCVQHNSFFCCVVYNRLQQNHSVVQHNRKSVVQQIPTLPTGWYHPPILGGTTHKSERKICGSLVFIK